MRIRSQNVERFKANKEDRLKRKMRELEASINELNLIVRSLRSNVDELNRKFGDDNAVQDQIRERLIPSL